MNRNAALTVLASCVLVGCGGGPTPIPIKGTLVYEDGKPISAGSVRFVPQGEGGRLAAGYTRKDGTFELTSFSAGDGILPGEYTIVVTKLAADPIPAPPATGPADPAELARQMREWMEKESKARVVDPVPAIYGSEKTSPLKWKVDSSTTEIKLKLNR